MAALPAAADVLNADLSGFNEVPTLSSTASADFHARINKDETEIQYELTYAGFVTPFCKRICTSANAQSTAGSWFSCAPTSATDLPARMPARRLQEP